MARSLVELAQKVEQIGGDLFPDSTVVDGAQGSAHLGIRFLGFT